MNNDEIYILKLNKIELDWIYKLVSLCVAESSKRFHEIDIPEGTHIISKVCCAKSVKQKEKITDPGPWHDYH